MAQLISTNTDKLIGARIQQKRREQGLSAEKLSEFVNLSQQQISRYERGASKINIAHLIDIAIFLRTPINWFFQDCLPEELTSEQLPKNNFDLQWDTLNNEQKERFISFLDSIRK
ncbi:helix-turn-helix domain-containing protein [Rodentibacter haemolyticus]|uniref:Helix-turn-helix transcriptional regulator n=1 Tax=Rodentibacter haemolyticus TaxID=2778911 RepID=A0ABX6V0N0_9PAST|nr:helix-turn-helix transcriptional regulator [Rodentibacter haemolyticus]QPB43672.1 helix-turn-helix transcriptional regulator [Rodentibacter haemolyticus]